MVKKTSTTVVNAVRGLLKKDPLKSTFLDLICNQMSERTLLNLNTDELHEFILHLYDFFIVKHHQKPHIYIGKPNLKSNTLTNSVVLKMSHPDAAHLFFTIEEILRKYRLKTTRRLHPLIGIKRNKNGDIIDIVEPTEDVERRSLVFIAFDQLPHQNIIELIKNDIHFHMACVQQSQQDTDAIFHQLSAVSEQLKLMKPSLSSDWIQLIQWLKNHNFSFFGCHVIHRQSTSFKIKTSLGICNPDANMPDLIKPNHLILEHTNNAPFIMDRTTITSPIQRFEPLMKISFKFNTSQTIFYGILKRSSMYAKNMDTPLINKKMDYIFSQRRFLTGSYDYNEVVRIFNDIPKFELFRLTREELLDMVDFIMAITNPNHIQCYKRYQPKSKQLKLYFVIPYYLFNPTTVQVITDTICQNLDIDVFESLPISAPEKCRLHLHFKLNKTPNLPDEEQIERLLTPQVQPWEDQVLQHILDQSPDMLTQYPNIITQIPSHYKVRTQPESAMRDIQRLVSLTDDNPIHFECFSFDYPTTSDLAGKVSMLLVYHRNKLDLTNILPILHNFGIHVIDQITSRFGDSSSTIGYILAFRLLDSNRKKLNESKIKDRLSNALTNVFQSQLPNDPINQLVLLTDQTSNDIFILQGLRNYMHQIFQSSFSLAIINQALIDHYKFCDDLITLFHHKFNPLLKNKDRETRVNQLTTALNKYIKSVERVTDDQILRRLLSIVIACVRTNRHVKSPQDPLSFKFQCDQIFGMPTPIPFRETFVFDYHLEGVHIRFGAVARGGLRFSNRIDDYRTEVLGLVKTQQTKNAVIIPVGSKGGFVIKSHPQPISYDASAMQYQRFITAMLQLTDNLVNGKSSRPKQLICHDEIDPYFVVAADKGTATFSDYANAISLDRNFWLGDGFASGGEHGYDHKKVGITAKGAWECTKLHFKSIQKNPEIDPLRVVAIGDMAGDVFGNGMLLSQSIQLVAAFNHQHIFIDPSPNPSKSWKERYRLFHMPQSSWTDYKGVSAGGGVFERSSKSIQCSSEIKTLFDIDDDALSGESLIQAILRSQVDLIWFGGIGTYIKSSTESHIDVGDPANNNVRINANEVRANVISEGANLAITQDGRIEYEFNGGMINTDAIDNSAGVNMSDYEVNIKILLSTLQASGIVKSNKSRNAILERATDEVTALVLNNNVIQHQLISMDQYRSTHHPYLIDHTISHLIKLGRLNHIDEQIPTSKERQELYKEGIPLPRPVLAKCQAYVKMWIKDSIAESPYFKGAMYDDIFYTYFPKTIQKLIDPSNLPDHRLKDQLIITSLTNHFVGLFGCASHELMTFSNQIPLDKAMHQLVILESVFDTHKKRAKWLEKWTSPSDYNAIFDLNQSCLHASLVCHLLNIPLSQSNIDTYKKCIRTYQSHGFSLSIMPILFNHRSPKKCVQILSIIDTAIGLLHNINMLESLSVKKHVLHTQKTAILCDLYLCLHHLLSFSESQLKKIMAASSTLKPVLSTKDILSNLFLYSFDLRQHLNAIKPL